MIELRTLGALDVRATDGRDVHPLLRQPKRCALFAYLALAGAQRFRRRDSIVAVFWPELDDGHARGALRQALRFLRRVLGEAVVVTRGDEEIGIDPTSVEVDARTFERLSEAGRTEDALAVYSGEFLDGFFLSDTGPAFDQWVEQERARLRRMAGRAAWKLADERRAAGDTSAALEMARRAAGFSPESEADAARVIAFLDESGDRAGALANYDALARRLEADFGTEPAPETRALVRDIRARTEPVGMRLPFGAAPRSPNEARAPASGRDAAARQHRLPRALIMLAAGAVLSAGTYVVAAAFHRRSASGSASIRTTVFRPTDTPLTEPAGHLLDPRARTLYIRGRYWWGRRGRENLFKAIGAFQQALDIDPTYAAAYSGMGDTYAQIGYGGYLRPDDAFPKAEAAALEALKLDSTLAEPHATLGYVAMYYRWKWNDAEREYRRALAISPNYPTAHEWYGLFLAAMGRFPDAQAEVRRALELDPLSLGTASTAAWVMHYSGEQAEAERQLRIALRTDSTFPVAHLYLGRVLQFNGQLDSALAHFAAMGPLRTWVPTLAGEGYVYAQQGRRDLARDVLQRLDSLSKSEYVTAYAVALVHAALGQSDSAFVWLNKAVDERTHWVLWLNRDRRWDPIRSDPRFRAVVQRVGVPR
jgi:DNA-binding SARP family transcriptional activator/Flp pilus assembly protein TadD